MKAIIIVLAVFLASAASADVYVLYDSNTKEVLSMQDDDSAVLEEGCTKKILPGTLENYPLEYHPKYYKYVNDKFVVNTKKMSDEELEKIKIQEELSERILIEKKLQDLAIDELKKDGITLKHIKKTGE